MHSTRIVTYPPTEKDFHYLLFVWYLTRNYPPPKDKDEVRFQLSDSDFHRLSLAEYFYDLEKKEEYILYHLTLTYKPLPEQELIPKTINRFFINFHLRYFLPLLLGTRNIHFSCNKLVQPKVIAFLDEHQKDKFSTRRQSKRLHHHVIVAVHQMHKKIMDNYVGVNTFKIIGNDRTPYMTSDLKPCGPMRVLYASKMYWKYPDFLSFPDSTKRKHKKYQMQKHTRVSQRRIKERFLQFPNSTYKFLRQDFEEKAIQN
jgi:hypothetical protein